MRQLLSTYVIVLALALMSCSKNSAGPDTEELSTFNVSVTAAPSDGGSISPTPNDAYEDGENIELQATANEGYVFAGWTGDMESSDNPLSFTVDQDYSLTANFEKKTYELTINTDGEGTVNEKVVQSKSKEYEHGTTVELTANPAKGYRFKEWTGDATGSDNPVQITVDMSKEVTAVFEKKSYALTITTTGEGTVSKDPDYMEYAYGDTVEVTANPASGWNFVEWRGDTSATDNPLTIPVDTTKEITAVFENPFEGGAGTASNPYKIATIEQLQKIDSVQNSGIYFIQINDIDASATANWNRGMGFDPITFSGFYDGQEHVISNLTIDRDQGGVGLFGNVPNGGGIKNITLENIDITGGRSTGGLVGTNIEAQVKNSHVSGKVHCTGRRCGGLVGDNYGTIENSSADVEVTSIEYDVGGLVGLNWDIIKYSYATGNVSGIEEVGGLVGLNYDSDTSYNQVVKSYAQGNVTGKDRIGGLIGSNRADTYVRYAYATGEVTPSTSGSATYIGGLIGRYDSNSIVGGCYWDTENTGQTEGAGGSTSLSSYNYGLTTAEMTGDNAKTNMSEFDFVSIWKSVSGGYPALFWE